MVFYIGKIMIKLENVFYIEYNIENLNRGKCVMIIDFHTHAFNEKIADKAISKLETIIGYSAFTKGTVEDNIKHFDEWGVDKAVSLSIATKPSQQKIINDWAASLKSDRIIPFGSVHPDAEDVLEELERIKCLGLKGIKLHPDYQNFYIDEERMFPIYEKCAKLSLVVVFHSGVDVLCPENVHATPDMCLRAFKAVPEMTMVLAHLGGNNLWEEVYEKLAGLQGNLYFDTALAGDICPDELIKNIIRKHGADRILLASDCPWHETITEVNTIKRIGLTDEEVENILYKNAERLLNI